VKAEELYSLAAARGEAEAQENLQALRTRKSIAGMALPQSVRGIVENLLSDQPVSFTDEAYLFLAGLANYFSNSCSLPESVADKSVIGTFLYGANQRAIFGNNYKGIDIGGQITGAGIMGLGVEAGRTVGCSSALTTQLSNAVVKAVKSNSSGSGGGPSIFVRTCSNQFDETRCNCLANLGRAVISDIYQQPYSRNVIVRIVNGNPFLALQVGLICNIVNY
jgi:hypothetical protein